MPATILNEIILPESFIACSHCLGPSRNLQIGSNKLRDGSLSTGLVKVFDFGDGFLRASSAILCTTPEVRGLRRIVRRHFNQPAIRQFPSPLGICMHICMHVYTYLTTGGLSKIGGHFFWALNPAPKPVDTKPVWTALDE